MASDAFDIFNASKIYPNPEHIFGTHQISLSQIKDNCIFILDTNALLVPYSTGAGSLTEIGKIYALLKSKNQLLIPDQVAREFANNRPKKIGEMFDAINKKRNGIPNLSIGQYPLMEGMEGYTEALGIELEMKDILKRYHASIGKIVNEVKNWSWDDPVSLIYREIFTPEIVIKLEFDKDQIKKNLAYRYLHKIPPGYKDSSKDDDGIGDYLIWLAILQVGRSKKNVVFVSGEEKPDWYHKSDKTALFPRFELITEFNDLSEGHHFQIIRLSDLLKIMGADSGAIEQVKEEEISIRHTGFSGYASTAEIAVRNFYLHKYGDVVLVDEMRYQVDFEYLDGDRKIGVIISNIETSMRRLEKTIRNLFAHIDTSIYDECDFVIVGESHDNNFEILVERAESMIYRFNHNAFEVNVKYGYLDYGTFVEISDGRKQIKLF
ncbi:hypothetical protein DBR43_30485 [Pedobacter sp. KBW06]|uniref:PIN domain-containing protein n=1 Tax=Pedobacter sp. KBW06 TaxID=2153359 RepID=UPI000F5A5B3B|nr:PIN domain-containing protein [Pedobacter sp. KBW06]RQO65184.1 hypothetical protein DBR43_30485 [Pedobacter sp. KBW06]